VAPLLGPRFKEAKLVGVSGKAMEVSVPTAGMKLRETVKRYEGEGHCFGFAASFVHDKEALAEPKTGEVWISRLAVRKLLSDGYLGWG
jgi:hypothetical protein